MTKVVSYSHIVESFDNRQHDNDGYQENKFRKAESMNTN